MITDKKLSLFFSFSVETKSIISDKPNHLSPVEVIEELEKRPFSASTAQFSDVNFKIDSISFIKYQFISSFLRIVKYLNQLQLSLIIHDYHR